VVDRATLAKKIASVRDAVSRIRSVLPTSRDAFLADRTAREVVILNLFVAVQECLALATHWLADAGWDVPQSHRDVLITLADHGVLDRGLAARIASASGLRNLVAHQYGVLDWELIHEIAATELDDLLSFCGALAEKAGLPE
jgi:uncharacterized protein YutE (UPF0331/DUF86 family)